MLPDWQKIKPIVLSFSALFGAVYVLASPIPVVNYLVQIAAVFGFIYLGYNRHYLIAGLSGVLALIFGIWLFGFSVFLLGSWAEIFVPSILLGVFISEGMSTTKAFLTASLIAAMIAIVVFISEKDLIFASIDIVKESTEGFVSKAGLPEITTARVIDEIDNFFALGKRLMPSFMVLSAILKLFIGWFALFALYKSANVFMASLGSFIYWKMPVYYVYITGLVLLGRLVGGESVAVMADNLLLVIGIFYAIFGFCLFEYFLKKIKLTLSMKILFYIGILLLQIPGLVMASIAGFIDSYFDFRKVRARIIG